MSAICRTCLQKSNKTFKTNQTIEDYNGGEVKISIVLRFCIPELYLGLSSNPEICLECTESLKAAYLFKKKCLYIENIIGNFLKNTRCTARSVDLFDVLGYLEDHVQVQLQQEVEKAKQKVSEDILSEWDDVPDEPVNSEKIAQELRQSTPNPVNLQDNSNQMKFCHETGLFSDQQGRSYDSSGCLINNIERVHVRAEVTNYKDPTVGEAQVMENRPNFVQDTKNMCRITNVFSLSTKITDKDPISNTNSVSNASGFKNANNTNGNLADMTEEPLAVEINGELVNFNCYPRDVEALPTTSNEDMQCTSRLQGIIDNLPEVCGDDHYVDVPEFVHINNFGHKELELRWQQQNNSTMGTKKIVLNFQNKLPSVSSLGPSNSSEENLKSKAKDGFTNLPFSRLPETLIVEGKKMVKCGQGYRLMEDSESKPFQYLNRVRKVVKRTNSATQGENKRRLPTA